MNTGIFPLRKGSACHQREVMEKFKIDVPICLYDIEDLRRLLDGFPVREVKLRSTAFGNVGGDL
jgi:hypothetical protein